MNNIKTDIEISQDSRLLPIVDIAKKLDIGEEYIDNYGKYKAKINLSIWQKIKDRQDGKLVLVTSINPTPAGEGKTTTTIGLGEALEQLGHKTCIALREPSLGPCFGLKGGATGGGYAQVVPMEDINLHFTGDIHAITSAHNLLAALIDNHIYHGNKLQFDLKNITWRRVLDLNDRALRNIVIGLGGKTDGVVRETGFDITVASEIMAILCLSKDINDLRQRINDITVGYNTSGEAITCEMLNATGALVSLLKDAINPNIVQTIHGTPAIIHGGPFANIAHGCSSIVGTKLALKLAKFTITEAGFGADLGAEKFLDIKCPLLGKTPDAVVIVATVRALKMHAYVAKDDLHIENVEAVNQGFANLEKHILNMKRYNLPIVVAINHFYTDTDAEIDAIRQKCQNLGVPVELSKVWEFGGEGGKELAKTVIKLTEANSGKFSSLYSMPDKIEQKIEKICKNIYGAKCVEYAANIKKKMQNINDLQWPVCIAKTPNSLTDDKNILGVPTEFKITITDVKVMTGAKFVVAYAGGIVSMPGLPRKPNAEEIYLSKDGKIRGLSYSKTTFKRL